MKVRTSEVKKEFKPFEINLTIETLEEARALHFIFNHYDITSEACPELSSLEVCDLLESRCEEAYNKQDFDKRHEILKKAIEGQ